MANELQDIRRSAVVMTFGPGAVIDFRAGGGAVSGIAAGLDEWDRSFAPAGLANFQKIHETRLQKKLGVMGFRLPPVPEDRFGDEEEDRRRLVAVRFPRWLQCPQCDRIASEDRWGDEPGKAFRVCTSCTAKAPGGRKVFAVPTRFVMACPKGHIDDFPWHWWVNHDPDCKNTRGALLLRSERPGLAGLIVRCPECGSSRSMDGIFAKKTWEHTIRCSGHRPWLPAGPEDCTETPIALQRGASNLYFPVLQTALSIPPWDDYLQEVLGTYWQDLVDVADDQREMFIQILSKNALKSHLEELKMTPAELAAAIERRIHSYGEINTDDLRPAEYRQLIEDGGREPKEECEFETRRENVPERLREFLSTIVRVVRLREVRALTGFTRIRPPGGEEQQDIAPLALTRKEWLPAIEVRGEGVFLAINERLLQQWQEQDDVRSRVAAINRHLAADWAERYPGSTEEPPAATARYVLCHSLAHALMRQLTLECGYSGASLQERIYASDAEGMAGLLIYTSTPDADGTLGGLQRQGTSARMEGILVRSIQAMEWCSSDPLCIADMMGAEASFSHSVCHSCALVPETSCEKFNQLLDRAMLVGTPELPKTGFFHSLLRN